MRIPCRYVLIVTCVLEVYIATAQTNVVDWSSASSVVSYLDNIVDSRHGAKNVLSNDLANINVSAYDLWAECLRFDISTNDYAAMSRFLKLREDVLFVVMRMESFTRTDRGRIAATNFLAKVSAVKAAGRGRPVPMPQLICVQAPSNASQEEIQRVANVNMALSNQYVVAVQQFENDKMKRKFYDALESFCSFLEFWSRSR